MASARQAGDRESRLKEVVLGNSPVAFRHHEAANRSYPRAPFRLQTVGEIRWGVGWFQEQAGGQAVLHQHQFLVQTLRL